jgi:hypothetical protein
MRAANAIDVGADGGITELFSISLLDRSYGGDGPG